MRQQSKHVDVRTHLIFRVREGRLLHGFIEGHKVCKTLVPDREKLRTEITIMSDLKVFSTDADTGGKILT